MTQLARIKYVEEYHDQSNVVCEELKEDLEVTAQHVVTIGKVIQKERSRKVGYYTWPIWVVQFILKNLVNGTPPASISPKIMSQASLAMPGG